MKLLLVNMAFLVNTVDMAFPGINRASGLPELPTFMVSIKQSHLKSVPLIFLIQLKVSRVSPEKTLHRRT